MSELTLPVRVYLEDTDAQGVVYNASYFRFMERARTEWLRARGVDHGALLERHRVLLVLNRVEAEFRAPSRLGDMLQVVARVTDSRGARVVFAHEIFVVEEGAGGTGREASGAAARERSGEQPNGARRRLVCRGTAEVACVDADSGKPRRLPATLRSEWSR